MSIPNDNYEKVILIRFMLKLCVLLKIVYTNDTQNYM